MLGDLECEWPAYRLVREGWTTLEGLDALSLDDILDANDVLDAIDDASAEV